MLLMKKSSTTDDKEYMIYCKICCPRNKKFGIGSPGEACEQVKDRLRRIFSWFEYEMVDIQFVDEVMNLFEMMCERWSEYAKLHVIDTEFL
jgi:hypothetical protein